jgi:hypothetical protein
MEETCGKNKKNIIHYWLSSVIKPDVMIWRDQIKDGKTNSIFKIKTNRSYWT